MVMKLRNRQSDNDSLHRERAVKLMTTFGTRAPSILIFNIISQIPDQNQKLFSWFFVEKYIQFFHGDWLQSFSTKRLKSYNDFYKRKLSLSDLRVKRVFFAVLTIFSDILDDAVELKSCQHYFCYSCIVLWDKTQQTANKVCPECRTAYKFADRQRPPRIFNKILCDLHLACPNALCTVVTNYDNFKKHQVSKYLSLLVFK